MTFFWQNPNPRIKKWVRELLEERPAVERAIGMPLREVLGCGHWGCVIDSKRPWVVKFTIDPNEAFIWTKINQLIEEERYGQGGVVRTDGIFQIEPRVMYGGRAKKSYAIIREEVAPAFTLFQGQLELTKATKKRLKINPGLRALYLHRQIFVEGKPIPTKHPVDEFIETVEALMSFRELASEWHRRPGNGGWGPYLTPVSERLERPTYRMTGGIGGAIGETLMMLLSNNVVLRDVHLFNVGWRKFDEIKGHGHEDKTLVIFDPGHTPTSRHVQIPVVWFQDEKR